MLSPLGLPLRELAREVGNSAHLDPRFGVVDGERQEVESVFRLSDHRGMALVQRFEVMQRILRDRTLED